MQRDLERILRKEREREVSVVSLDDFRYTQDFQVWKAVPELCPGFTPQLADL
jgi:hypothetical protein